MGIRRQARESAMQALFCMDMSGSFSRDMLSGYCRSFADSSCTQPFFEQLVTGIMDQRAAIDTVIEQHSSNWKMRRMACVDRNILRIAVFELLYCADIPFKVTINEAIDIGKKFGAPESGAFINGILDSIRLAIEKGHLATAKATGDGIVTEQNAINGQ